MEGELHRFFSTFFENSMLKFFDDLFNHVLLESENIEGAARFDHLPMAFPLYQPHVGKAIVQILGVTSQQIDQFYGTVREKIEDRGNFRIFVSRLGAKFLQGPPENCLYFLTVTSRIFSLMYKSDETELSTFAFIEECVKALESTASGPNAMAGIKELPVFVHNILKNEDWRDKFRDLNCGDASDYFSS